MRQQHKYPYSKEIAKKFLIEFGDDEEHEEENKEEKEESSKMDKGGSTKGLSLLFSEPNSKALKGESNAPWSLLTIPEAVGVTDFI